MFLIMTNEWVRIRLSAGSACREFHKDEEDPELMFQDWEYIPEGLIGESWLSDNIFEIIEAMDDMDNDRQEAFAVWLAHESHDLDKQDINDLISKFNDDFQGKYDDEEDYAYHIVEECYDLPEFALNYFDYEKFANTLFCTDYWCEDGYVFSH